MRRNIPKVVDTYLLTEYKEINIGSEAWFKWLEKNNVFGYVPAQFSGYYYTRQNITVKKRSNGYWYGLRTFNNKQLVKYIGKSEALEYEKLQEVVDALST